MGNSSNGSGESFILRKRPRYERGFTITDNQLLQDTKRLSYRAIGVMAHLWSLSDNAPVSAQALADKGQEGRDAIRTALNELAAAGYIKRERRSTGRRQWAHYVHLADQPIYANAQVATSTDSQAPDNPTVGNPGDKSVKDQEPKDSPSPNGDGRANIVMGSWLESSGLKLTVQTRARLGKSIKDLLAANVPESDIAVGLDLWGERLTEGARITPANLPDFVDQARNRREAKAEVQAERGRARAASSRPRQDDPTPIYQTGTPERVPDDKLATAQPGALYEAAGLPIPEHVRKRMEAVEVELAAEDAQARAEGRCCASHSRTCEPPSELCCYECSEADHPRHPEGVACVLGVTAE